MRSVLFAAIFVQVSLISATEVSAGSDNTGNETHAFAENKIPHYALLNYPAPDALAGRGKNRDNTISFRRFNLRFGFGYTIADSGLNGLPAILKNIRSSWQVKTDFLYKFGAYQNAVKNVRKSHSFGIFMQYGRQTAANAGRILGENHQVNTAKPSRGFLEIETGMMLREELRISGGAGLMNYYRIAETQQERTNKTYYCFTVGVSPRLLPFLELDLNLGGVLINGNVKPRASISAVLLLKAK